MSENHINRETGYIPSAKFVSLDGSTKYEDVSLLNMRRPFQVLKRICAKRLRINLTPEAQMPTRFEKDYIERIYRFTGEFEDGTPIYREEE